MAKAKATDEETPDPDAVAPSNMGVVEPAQDGDPYVGNARVVYGPVPAGAATGPPVKDGDSE